MNCSADRRAKPGVEPGPSGGLKAGYLIADRLGMSVALIPHLFGATNRFPPGSRACSPSGARAAV
jgi:hypothetical protein